MEVIKQDDEVHSLLHSITSVIKNSNFESDKSNKDHIKYILNQLDEKKNTPTPLKINKKCSIIAEEFRSNANEYLKSNLNLDIVLEELTKSIANAPPGSVEISKSYGDRSAVLFDARLISDCLLDLNQALTTGYPENLKIHLYLRQAMCHQILNPDNSKLIEKCIKKVQELLKLMDSKEQEIILEKLTNIKSIDRSKFYKWNADKHLPKLQNENKIIPGLSDAIELKYSDEFGRHMIAKRNIKPGEVLMLQKPYAKIVNTQMRYKYCWNCAEQVWASIPCNCCTDVIYCSEICRKNGNNNYHEYECPIINDMINLKMNEGSFVSLRLTILAYNEAGKSLETLMHHLDKIDAEKDPLMKGCTNNILEPKKYSSVYGLITHSNNLIPSKCEFVIDSIIIGYLLATRTNIIGKNLPKNLKDLKNNKLFIFLINLIEKNMEISNYNSFSIEGNTPYQKFRMILPCASFFNHSCHQKIIRRLHGEYMTSFSLYPIEQGDQIFDNYGIYYDQLSKDERQSELLSLYNFICTCEACTYDWPMCPLETNDLYKNFKNFTKMTLRIAEIYHEYLIAKKIVNSYGRKYNCVPDLSNIICELVKIVDKFCHRFRKNSIEVVNAIFILDGLLTLTENRYFDLCNF
ncbi:SET and MYND domain-containing protein 4-like [Aphidius gifuensis]|uniref:SET and MYND domain-containing protein 4-like n=1 Tax=Aphidius gifuensis TaxID=684658 RepID=UPI001CDCC7F0|nr:SET and MYND domain-containing protein 4-like [Aphidius gifuensis]